MIHLLAGALLLFARDATPEATVRGAMDALNHQLWKELFSRIDGAKITEATDALARLNQKKSDAPSVEVKDVKLTTTGDTATGTVSFVFPMRPDQPGTGQTAPVLTGEVTLKNVGGDWKISGGKGIFDELVKFAKDPSVVQAQAHKAAERTVILSNFKQIALGVLLYTNDHQDKVAMTQATLKAKLQPYLKNEKVWLGPDNKPLDIRINPNLVGKSMTSVAEPAATVMLSLGPKSNLVYFEDRTFIAYVDGHVKTLTKAGISALKW